MSSCYHIMGGRLRQWVQACIDHSLFMQHFQGEPFLVTKLYANIPNAVGILTWVNVCRVEPQIPFILLSQVVPECFSVMELLVLVWWVGWIWPLVRSTDQNAAPAACSSDGALLLKEEDMVNQFSFLADTSFQTFEDQEVELCSRTNGQLAPFVPYLDLTLHSEPTLF